MDDEPDTTTEYERLRSAYWDAQRVFRERAVDEIIALLPVGIDAVTLQINDTPRLAMHRYVDSDGVEWYPEDWLEEHPGGDPYADDAIDQIANDLEANDWDEADSFLMSTGDGRTFVIERPTTPGKE
jgi:hypothetical protein